MDVARKFIAGKFAPVPALVAELINGQTMVGEDVTLSNEVFSNTIPLYLQDINDAIKEIGSQAIFTVGIPGFFGVGTQTYQPSKKNKYGLPSF